MSGELPTRMLGSTGIRITELGFGAASIGNLYRETSDADARDAVDAAWDAGIRSFDTAPHYGLGLSERRLGAALAGRARDEYVLSTKVGRRLEPVQPPWEQDPDFVVPATHRREWDFSRDGIRRSLDESLERLGVDAVDVLYLHDPDQHDERSAFEGAEVLSELKDQGVIRARGVGTNSAAQIPELFARGLIDVAMLAGRYTLLERERTAVDAASAAGGAIVAVGVFNSGLLAVDRPAADASYDYGPVPASVLSDALRLADACERAGITLPRAAIAFPLRRSAVANVTLGMRTADQVRRNVALYRAGVDEEAWSVLGVTD